jgi:hypothetical protein
MILAAFVDSDPIRAFKEASQRFVGSIIALLPAEPQSSFLAGPLHLVRPRRAFSHS